MVFICFRVQWKKIFVSNNIVCNNNINVGLNVNTDKFTNINNLILNNNGTGLLGTNF